MQLSNATINIEPLVRSTVMLNFEKNDNSCQLKCPNSNFQEQWDPKSLKNIQAKWNASISAFSKNESKLQIKAKVHLWISTWKVLYMVQTKYNASDFLLDLYSGMGLGRRPGLTARSTLRKAQFSNELNKSRYAKFAKVTFHLVIMWKS